jgi:hypothetical protein
MNANGEVYHLSASADIVQPKVKNRVDPGEQGFASYS